MYSIQYIIQCRVYKIIYSLQYTIQFTVYSIQYSSQFTVYSIQYSLQYTVYNTAYSIQYTIQCTVYSIQYSLQCTVEYTGDPGGHQPHSQAAGPATGEGAAGDTVTTSEKYNFHSVRNTIFTCAGSQCEKERYYTKI